MAHDSVLLIRAKALLRAFIVHHSSFVSGRVLDVVEVVEVLDFSAPLSSDSASANPSSSGIYAPECVALGSGMRSITLLASEVVGFARTSVLALKILWKSCGEAAHLPLATCHCQLPVRDRAAAQFIIHHSSFVIGKALPERKRNVRGKRNVL